MRYFIKINPKNILYGSYGQAMSFPDFGNGHGGVETENENTIRELTLAIQRNRGGVKEVNAKEYESLKKKVQSLTPSRETQSANLRTVVNRFGGNRRDAAGANDLKMPNREENLLMPSAPAKPTGFRPKAVKR